MAETSIRAQVLACRDAAQVVAALSTDAKNALLREMASFESAGVSRSGSVGS